VCVCVCPVTTITSVVSSWEAQSLTSKEHKLQVFVNKVVRKVF